MLKLYKLISTHICYRGGTERQGVVDMWSHSDKKGRMPQCPGTQWNEFEYAGLFGKGEDVEFIGTN